MKKILLILNCLLLLTSCGKEFAEDDNLSMIRTNYDGNELKTNGYYYTIFEGRLDNFSFFYKNGVYLDVGGSKNNFQDASNYITNFFLIERSHQNIKDGWGIFKIQGDNIGYERWKATELGRKAYTRTGKILNDTTFIVTTSFRAGDGFSKEIKKINETYYFKKFSPKPDSLNIYVR